MIKLIITEVKQSRLTHNILMFIIIEIDINSIFSRINIE